MSKPSRTPLPPAVRTNLPAGHYVAAPLGLLLQLFKPECLKCLEATGKRPPAQRRSK